MLNYKEYIGSIEVDVESGLLHGRVLDIRDMVTVQGVTVAEARQELETSVDDYLDFCAELGQEPEKPFSGKLPFRTSAEHHRLIFLEANKAGKSMNAWMDEVLVQEAKNLVC
ncbi:type II toxin-antitoxin system HicB family antitoxin [Chamaesiphon sp. VAR_69_metabat_338]|uniref:type II toxin-antitoxin system HicB family antitoxin n=1 Tax=Chamaesiphon sp. VAR_69_metabat_338 TaxID=2964704 RepID=UPI00286D8649|nr:type II toxin-antitoxin system HicB family antitoxin [Chamaesiphon sp. VAR_69_metabat_338]